MSEIPTRELTQGSLGFSTRSFVRVRGGSVNGGWLGRVFTTLHLHAPYILTTPAPLHDTSARHVWCSRGGTRLSRRDGLRKLQTCFLSLQTRSSQPCSLKVMREATESRLYRHADWPLGDFAVKRNTASRVLRDRLCHEVMTRFVHDTTNAIQPLRFSYLVSGSTRCL